MHTLNHERILILEEQPSIGRLVVDMLDAMNGQAIGPAERLPEALALLAENEVDAAILDVKVEGQPSSPVADELIRRGIPFAFASANSVEELARDYPGIPILTKPFSSEHLEHVLEDLLASH